MIKSRAWLLFLLSGIYLVGELGHFLIGVVSRKVAQEIHYGELGCLLNGSDSAITSISSHICEDVKNSNQCLETSLNGSRVCKWDYTGLGLEYQWLAGPSYIVAFTISGVAWGLGASWMNRIYLLGSGTLIFSIAIAATAFAKSYWHLVLLRAFLAIGEAACSPLSASIISDTFAKNERALAMSLFNWGIYIGYGFSYAIGTYVTEANVLGYGWRSSFLISGAPGVILGILLLITVRDPYPVSEDHKISLPSTGSKFNGRDESPSIEIIGERNYLASDDKDSSWRSCLHPIIILLTIAACFRHTAGYSWGYNSALYFQNYYPDYDAGWWLTCISIFGGAAGSAIGGYVADRLIPKYGIASRALVLSGSQLLAAPFIFGLLYFEPPIAFFSLLIGYLAAEMWFGVLFAIFIELVPFRLRSASIGIALFVINNVGGNLPVLVAPISDVWNLRGALTLFYPVSILISSALFLLCYFWLRLKK